MSVLVIAPHPDDEAIGCGGALCLHVDGGERVAAVFLTSGELGLKHLPREEAWKVRETEAESAAAVLGLASVSFLRRRDYYLTEEIEVAARDLEGILRRETPAVVYVPHEHEWHPDHAIASTVLESALACSGIAPPSVLTYEVWTPQAEYDDGRDITSVMRRKLSAVRCYRSQTRQLPYARAVRWLNEFRGAMAWGCRYAEVFKVTTLSADATA